MKATDAVTPLALLQEDVLAAHLDRHIYRWRGLRWLYRRNRLRGRFLNRFRFGG
jgi:hypothetical protein